MISAIPMKNDRISNHFKKSELFALFDDSGNKVDELTIFALNETDKTDTCCGHTDMAALLQLHHVDLVFIRNIGQKSLAKLLDAGLKVFQVSKNFSGLPADPKELIPFTHASQGRPSVKHERKLASGAGGSEHHACHSSADSGKGSCCQKAGAKKKTGGRCCQS